MSAPHSSFARPTVLALVVLLLTLLYGVGCEIYNAAAQQGPVAHQTLYSYTRGNAAFPLHAVDQVAAVKGVAHAVGIVGLGGEIGGAAHQFDYFQAMAVGSGFLAVQPQFDVSKAVRERWEANRRGAIVGPKVMQKLGLRVGQLVTLRDSITRGNGSDDWNFVVEGVYGAPPGVNPFYIILHYDYINQGRRGNRNTVDYILATVSESGTIGRVAERIDARFRNSLTPSVTQTVAALHSEFISNIGFLRSMLIAIAIATVVIFIGLVVCAYVLEMRQRLPQLAVLRALGFGRLRIAVSAMADAWVRILPAGLVGLALAVPISYLARQLQPRFLMYFALRPENIILAVAVLIGVSIAMGLFTAWITTRHGIGDAMRAEMVL